MILALSRVKLREDAPLAEYAETMKRMEEIVSGIPGFIARKVYWAEDGERVGVYEFESEEALNTWHDHPEHVQTQERAREAFYESYYIAILDAKVIRTYDWTRAGSSDTESAPWWYTPLKSE